MGTMSTSTSIPERNSSGPNRSSRLRSHSYLPVEPAVRSTEVDLVGLACKPSNPLCWDAVEGGNVRLEVEDRCAVEEIETADVKAGALDAVESDDRQPDRVGVARRPCREHAAWSVVEERDDRQPRWPGSVEVREHVNVREAFEIAEAVGEGRFDLDRAVHVFCSN